MLDRLNYKVSNTAKTENIQNQTNNNKINFTSINDKFVKSYDSKENKKKAGGKLGNMYAKGSYIDITNDIIKSGIWGGSNYISLNANKDGTIRSITACTLNSNSGQYESVTISPETFLEIMEDIKQSKIKARPDREEEYNNLHKQLVKKISGEIKNEDEEI